MVKRLADHYGVAIVLVHHARKDKGGTEDFLAEVSGTNGLAGASDATLVLKRARAEADGVLHITGRDVTEAEYALKFGCGSSVGTAPRNHGPDMILGCGCMGAPGV